MSLALSLIRQPDTKSQIVITLQYADMLRQPARSQQVMRQHILLGKLTLEDLQRFDHFYSLQGNIADLQVRVVSLPFHGGRRGFV